MADVSFIPGTGDIKRKELMILADVSEDGTDDLSLKEWELQGHRIEEMSIEMNPNVETMTDITGVSVTSLDKYEPQTSVEPYYAKRDSKFATKLYNIVRNRKTLSDVEIYFLVVNVFAGADGAFDAWVQKAIVAVTSFGGDTKGLQIPYTIYWTGEVTYGTVSISGGKATFTPAEE